MVVIVSFTFLGHRKEQKYVACYIKARRSIITRIDVLTLARLTRDRSLVEINFSPRLDFMKGFDRERTK